MVSQRFRGLYVACKQNRSKPQKLAGEHGEQAQGKEAMLGWKEVGFDETANCRQNFQFPSAHELTVDKNKQALEEQRQKTQADEAGN